MNIGILYGKELNEDSDDIEVAKDVYDIDHVVFIEEITATAINNAQFEVACGSENVLIVTNDILGDMGIQRSLYADAPRLMFVQSATNLRKNYGHLYPVN